MNPGKCWPFAIKPIPQNIALSLYNNVKKVGNGKVFGEGSFIDLGKLISNRDIVAVRELSINIHSDLCKNWNNKRNEKSTSRSIKCSIKERS